MKRCWQSVPSENRHLNKGPLEDLGGRGGGEECATIHAIDLTAKSQQTLGKGANGSVATSERTHAHTHRLTRTHTYTHTHAEHFAFRMN